ncbi:MAG: cbb3-type cytochrome c oxidase subunit II [Lacipirellulaceae bacterium]
MFESKSGVLLLAGLGFFLFAFLSNALVPILLYRNLPEKTVEELADNQNLIYQFEDLSVRYPEQFDKYYGEPSKEKLAEALELGRDIYVGEGCWHCHSQNIRPVSNESTRWGKVSYSEEVQNELNRPVMWGTRRVGPDLAREGGRRGNDWHAAHFFDPAALSPSSPMPRYPWFYDDKDPNKPNKRGIAIITYIQWLGSWLEEYPHYEDYVPLEEQMVNPLE